MREAQDIKQQHIIAAAGPPGENHSFFGEEVEEGCGLKMSLSRFLSRSLPVERLLDPDSPGAAGGGGGAS